MSNASHRPPGEGSRPLARIDPVAARVTGLLLLLSLIGCGATVVPRFEPTGSLDPSIGRGHSVRLEVVDKRANPSALGSDTTKFPHYSYKLGRTARDIVYDALIEALAEGGYQVASDADTLYLVEIREFSSTVTPPIVPFGKNTWTSSVALEARLRRDGSTVATRHVSAESSQAVASISGNVKSPAVGETASAALALAAEKLVADEKLTRAIDPMSRPPVIHVSSRPPSRRYASLYGRRFAVVVGVNEYEAWPKLEGAVPDARRVAESLRRRGFDEVIEVYDADATREHILRLLGAELPRKTRSEDLAVIFFAGHGQTETLPNGEKRGYVIPVDGTTDSVFATAISMDQLRSLSGRMEAKHVYYVMDSCYSGLGFVRGIRPIEKTSDYVAKVTSYRAVQMITAGQEGEMASEQGGRGIFTTYWLRALDGEADFDGDGYVTANEIGAYVPGEVTNVTDSRQTPLYGTLEGNGQVVFPVR